MHTFLFVPPFVPIVTFIKCSPKMQTMGRLFAALQLELNNYKNRFSIPLESIFFGGGTPSLAPIDLLETFLGNLSPLVAQTTEVTIEVNPESANHEKFRAWRQMGINRLSLGVQSLQAPMLKSLERVHAPADIISTIKVGKQTFSNFSADLIYGVPGQKSESTLEDIRVLHELGVTHFSTYSLTLHKEHTLFQSLPDVDEVFRQSQAINEAMVALGYHQYEVSNYAQPDCESRHNKNYWERSAYLGVGPSAHSYNGSLLRWKNWSSWKKYCDELERGTAPIEWEEKLTRDERTTEFLLTGLRTTNGININDFNSLVENGAEASSKRLLDQFSARGLGKWSKSRWVPTFKGLMLADEIALKLLTRA